LSRVLADILSDAIQDVVNKGRISVVTALYCHIFFQFITKDKKVLTLQKRPGA